MANAVKLMPFILKWEGGYICDKDDLGGATNKGITLNTFRHYYGQNKTVEDLKNLSTAHWLYIFKEGFWNRWKADEIKSQSVANILVDWLWASGIYGISRVQRYLGLTVDGIVGEKTISKINSENPKSLFNEIKLLRLSFIEEICKSRPQNNKFKQGWINRINAIKYQD